MRLETQFRHFQLVVVPLRKRFSGNVVLPRCLWRKVLVMVHSPAGTMHPPMGDTIQRPFIAQLDLHNAVDAHPGPVQELCLLRGARESVQYEATVAVVGLRNALVDELHSDGIGDDFPGLRVTLNASAERVLRGDSLPREIGWVDVADVSGGVLLADGERVRRFAAGGWPSE
jgi:hypothetical protein